MPKQTAVTKFNAALQAAKTQIEESSYLKIAVFENKIKEIEQKKLTAPEIPAVQKELSELKKLVEDSRKIYSEPLFELTKQNNAQYKPIIDRIDSLNAILKKAYFGWVAQEEAKRRAENAERERKAAEERARIEEENRKRLEKGKKPLPSTLEIIVPATPPIAYVKSAAPKSIEVEIKDFAKLVLAIAAHIKDPVWNEIISGFKTQPIQMIARSHVSQKTIDMFMAAGVEIRYLPTMEAWGATD